MEILFIAGSAALGLFFLWLRLSWKRKLQLLGWSLAVDIAVAALMYTMHAGSFAGVAVATLGSLACSVMLGCLKWAFGHIDAGVYHPGLFDMSRRIE